MRTVADAATYDNVVRISPALVQPVAAEDIAGALADITDSAPATARTSSPALTGSASSTSSNRSCGHNTTPASWKRRPRRRTTARISTTRPSCQARRLGSDQPASKTGCAKQLVPCERRRSRQRFCRLAPPSPSSPFRPNGSWSACSWTGARSPRVVKVDVVSIHKIGNVVEVRSPDDVDDELRQGLRTPRRCDTNARVTHSHTRWHGTDLASRACDRRPGSCAARPSSQESRSGDVRQSPCVRSPNRFEPSVSGRSTSVPERSVAGGGSPSTVDGVVECVGSGVGLCGASKLTTTCSKPLWR